jgi:hypothetical protein
MGSHRWEMGHHGCTEKGSSRNCLECMGCHGWEMGHHGCTKKGQHGLPRMYGSPCMRNGSSWICNASRHNNMVLGDTNIISSFFCLKEILVVKLKSWVKRKPELLLTFPYK